MEKAKQDMDDHAAKEKIKATLELLKIVADVIKELKRVPSGELYARLMEFNVSLEMYNPLIEAIKRAGLIEEKNHLLIWVGPQ